MEFGTWIFYSYKGEILDDMHEGNSSLKSFMACIRESVDSLCRDGADTPMPPYIGKAFTRTNFEDLKAFLGI